MPSDNRQFHVAVPILFVSSSAAAEAFYCTKLGFRKKFAYRPNASLADPCYMGLERDGAQLVVSSFAADGPHGGHGVQFYVEDADALYREYLQADLAVGTLWDQTWGNRDFSMKDADGNRLTFSQELESYPKVEPIARQISD
jgi:catechol 2,3-dioxygenase-like lactoylglutathione lyase family enzyme